MDCTWEDRITNSDVSISKSKDHNDYRLLVDDDHTGLDTSTEKTIDPH